MSETNKKTDLEKMMTEKTLSVNTLKQQERFELETLYKELEIYTAVFPKANTFNYEHLTTNRAKSSVSITVERNDKGEVSNGLIKINVKGRVFENELSLENYKLITEMLDNDFGLSNIIPLYFDTLRHAGANMNQHYSNRVTQYAQLAEKFKNKK
mgnify:CR=1 FL=1